MDWEKKEQVRASLRRYVRRLLAKYRYPPASRLPAAIEESRVAFRQVVTQALAAADPPAPSPISPGLDSDPRSARSCSGRGAGPQRHWPGWPSRWSIRTIHSACQAFSRERKARSASFRASSSSSRSTQRSTVCVGRSRRSCSSRATLVPKLCSVSVQLPGARQCPPQLSVDAAGFQQCWNRAGDTADTFAGGGGHRTRRCPQSTRSRAVDSTSRRALRRGAASCSRDKESSRDHSLPAATDIMRFMGSLLRQPPRGEHGMPPGGMNLNSTCGVAPPVDKPTLCKELALAGTGGTRPRFPLDRWTTG